MNFLLIFCSSALSFLLGYLRHIYSYWQQLGVPQLRTHFLYGNFFKLQSLQLTELLQQSYAAHKATARLAGSYVYGRPIALIIDLELISHILLRDSGKFSDAAVSSQSTQLRKLLLPAFGSKQLKLQFHSVVTVARQLQATLQQAVQAAANDACLELHELHCRYASDVLSSCIFGIDGEALQQPQSELSLLGRRLFNAHAQRNVRWHLFKATYAAQLQRLPLRCVDKQSTHYFKRILQQLQQSGSEFAKLLKQQQDRAALTLEQLATQLVELLADAYVSSASQLSFALYELAQHEQMQQRLRREIQQVLSKQQLSYQSVQQMTYLEQVINETQRKYPNHVALRRIATEDYRLSGADDHIELERGSQLYIPVHAIHHDAEIYTNPEQFQPARFERQASQQRHAMAFLDSGSPLERLLVKLGLIAMLPGHCFSLPANAATQLDMAKTAGVTTPKDGVHFCVQRLRSN